MATNSRKNYRTAGRGKRAVDGRLTQQRILACAIKLFANKGYAAVSTREIASASSVTVPTLYLYFGDKEGLYHAACVEVFERNARSLASDLALEAPPGERVFQIISRLAQFMIDDPDLNKLFQRELLEENSPHLEEIGRSVVSKSFGELEAALKRLLGSAAEPRTALCVHALVFGLIHFAKFKGVPKSNSLGARYSANDVAECVLKFGLPEAWEKIEIERARLRDPSKIRPRTVAAAKRA